MDKDQSRALKLQEIIAQEIKKQELDKVVAVYCLTSDKQGEHIYEFCIGMGKDAEGGMVQYNLSVEDFDINKLQEPYSESVQRAIDLAVKSDL